MPLPVLLAPVVGFFLREIILKFVIMGVVYLVLITLIPILLNLVGGFLSADPLTLAFSNLSPGVWWFLDFFELGYGLPKLLSAACAVFIVRRLPFIG